MFFNKVIVKGCAHLLNQVILRFFWILVVRFLKEVESDARTECS